MDRTSIIGILRNHQQELRELGLLRVALFGSFANGSAGNNSDIDLLSALDKSKDLSLLDVVHIENYLSDLLGRKVDLVDEGSLDPRLRATVQKTLVNAF